MSNRIEIKEGNVVEIFQDDNTVPFLRQPNWPNQSPWADAAEAQMWAEQFVESIENEQAPFAAVGPNEPRQPKPTAEQIAAMQTLNNPQSTEEERAAARALLEPSN